MNRGQVVGERQLPSLFPPGVVLEYGGSALPDAATWGVWLWADNSLVDRSQYPDLFKAISFNHSPTPGTDPGGGKFYLPSRKGRVAFGMDAGQTEFNTLGLTGGSKTSTAPHSHPPGSHSHTTGDHGVDHTHYVNANSFNSGGTTGGSWSGNHNHVQGGGHNHWVNAEVFSTVNSTHAHNGGGGQYAESPGTGSGGTGFGTVASTSSQSDPTTAGQGQDHVHNCNHDHGTNAMSAGYGTTLTHSLSGPTASNTGSGSADVASGNLEPYVVMNYIVKA